MPKESKMYVCTKCRYLVNNKAKYERHLKTSKHLIALNGISCCGLLYFDKHKWVNHKKSTKHMMHLASDDMSSADDAKESVDLSLLSKKIIVNPIKISNKSTSYSSAETSDQSAITSIDESLNEVNHTYIKNDSIDD